MQFVLKALQYLYHCFSICTLTDVKELITIRTSSSAFSFSFAGNCNTTQYPVSSSKVNFCLIIDKTVFIKYKGLQNYANPFFILNLLRTFMPCVISLAVPYYKMAQEFFHSALSNASCKKIFARQSVLNTVNKRVYTSNK